MSETTIKTSDFKYEVKVYESGPTVLGNTYEAIAWLDSKNLEHWIDFELDMYGGMVGYTTFSFWSKELATEFALSVL